MQLFIFFTAHFLLILYLLLFVFYIRAWRKIPGFYPDGSIPTTFISVIIPARNEAHNLPALLNCLQHQSYPQHLYEVLIIDDHSTDTTAAIIRNAESTHLRLISLKDHIGTEALNSYKKKAIEIGIRQSKGSLIVTTDADCTMQPGWLQTIATFYEKSKPAFIAAPVNIHPGDSLIQLFQSIDFMTLQGITGAGINSGLHNMCNGANLAYEKKAFLEVAGFTGIDNIASGDDMLLMHKIAKLHPEKIAYLKSDGAIVETAPVKTIKEFFAQRIRWASKAGKYTDKRLTAVLLIVYLFNLMLFVMPLAAMWNNQSFYINLFHISLMQGWFIIIGIKILVELYFLYFVAGFFKERKLLLLFPLLQPFHIIYIIVAGWLGISGSYKWKGRAVK